MCGGFVFDWFRCVLAGCWRRSERTIHWFLGGGGVHTLTSSSPVISMEQTSSSLGRNLSLAASPRKRQSLLKLIKSLFGVFRSMYAFTLPQRVSCSLLLRSILDTLLLDSSSTDSRVSVGTSRKCHSFSENLGLHSLKSISADSASIVAFDMSMLRWRHMVSLKGTETFFVVSSIMLIHCLPKQPFTTATTTRSTKTAAAFNRKKTV
mmetsp:Transcript_16054/g.32933  ORF Transcript_16054/g.32933 Transcript_16054/m.32933 type:complete len:207 (+) Transcript_16054:1554-2174(+)